MTARKQPYLNYRHCLKEISTNYEVPGISAFFSCRSEKAFATQAYLFLHSMDIISMRRVDLIWAKEFMSCTALFTLVFTKCPYNVITALITCLEEDIGVLEASRKTLESLLLNELLLLTDRRKTERNLLVRRLLNKTQVHPELYMRFIQLSELANNRILFDVELRKLLKDSKRLYEQIVDTCPMQAFKTLLAMDEYAFPTGHLPVSCNGTLIHRYASEKITMTYSDFREMASGIREKLQKDLQA